MVVMLCVFVIEMYFIILFKKKILVVCIFNFKEIDKIYGEKYMFFDMLKLERNF